MRLMAATSWTCHVNICSPVPMPPNVPFIFPYKSIPPNQVQIIQNYQSHRYISKHTNIYIYIIYTYIQNFTDCVCSYGQVFEDDNVLTMTFSKSCQKLCHLCCTAPHFKLAKSLKLYRP